MKSQSRRDFMKILGMGSAAVSMGYVTFCQRDKQKYPNIVYILADDMGYGDPHCNNQESKIPTPNIDRLADEGVRFTDAHAGSAVCTPTRYGILTGRYCWRTRLKKGVLWGYSPPLIEKERMTVASLLKRYGYQTACVGKWHLGLGWATTDNRTISDRSGEKGETIDYSKSIQHGPNNLGFDYFFGIPASLDMVPYVYIENDKVVEAPTNTIEGTHGLDFYRGGPCAPGFKHEETLDVLTEKAVSFIDRHMAKSPQAPFFLYFPLTAPHTPVLPKELFKESSRAGEYGDFVVQVDWTVGEVMKVLERHGVSENTLIIVTSDNGSTMLPMEEYDHLPNWYLRGRKSDIWDGGHRIPFFARWPEKIKPRTTNDEIICLTDLISTCAAIVGDPLPENAGEDSTNILPALKGKKLEKPIREATIHHSIEGMFSIRKGRWKMIEGRGSGGWTKGGEDDPALGQLYDLVDDYSETMNIYLERPDVVKHLTELLEKYKREGRSIKIFL